METLLKNETSEKEDKNESSQPAGEPSKNFPQYLAAASASLILMVSGTTLGWTSPVLPKLMSDNSTVPVSLDQSTWIGSLVAIGAIFGPYPAGFAADLMGRKRALLVTALPHLISWCILAVANSVPIIYAGRILSGLSNGWGMTLLPMYVGEIATPSERGALGVIGQILITLGFLYVYVLGPMLSYVWINIFCSFLPVVFFIFFFFMPETPYYELKKNNHDQAEKCLARLRGRKPHQVKEELNALRAAVEESFQNVGSWSQVFTVKSNRKALFIMFGLMTIQQLSGINCVLFYSELIFKKAGNLLNPSLSTIIGGLVLFFASFPAPYLVEQLGRRVALILSVIAMAIFQAVIGCCFYLETLSYDTSKIGWLPLASVIGYLSFYSIGIGPIPWAMIGEMFASNIRSKGASLTTSFSWLLAFFVTKSFGFIVEFLGDHWAFWLFATFCTMGVIFVHVFLPETKGKTLEEIQEMLKN